MANLVRNLKNQCRTPSMTPASSHHPPMEHNLQVTQTLPPWRPRRITLTQARRRRRHHGAHLKPTRSPKPEKTTPNKPQRAADRETSPSGHNCDEDSFDAFMESCMSDPHAIPTPAAPRVRL